MCGDVQAARRFLAAAERQLSRYNSAHPIREHLEAFAAATAARIAVADGDIAAAREQAARAHRAAVDAQDMPLLTHVSGAVAELALALGQPEVAAELLGAGTVVRGGGEATDTAAVQLVPRLRAALGADSYERAYQNGKALDRQAAVERLDPALLDQVRRT